MSRDSNFSHRPVLLGECIEALAIRADGIYVDCTAGGGGHSSAILRNLSANGRLISFDKDDDALKACTELRDALALPGRWDLVKSDFSRIREELLTLHVTRVDGVLADLGVSSHQLDTAERGFSYATDGPLDMRMDKRQSVSAETVIRTYSEDNLAKIFRIYGEERYAGRIAAAIVAARREREIRTTKDLSDIIVGAMPGKAKHEDQHPARRCFQAIRIEVNQELAAVSKLLSEAPSILSDQGRLAIISFHSLEDRLVKEAFKELEAPCTCPREFPVCVCNRTPMGRVITRKPIEATESEARENKRSRSAKLRVFERNGEEWKLMQ